MAKKQYKIEIGSVNTSVIAALKAANIDFTLFEVNIVKEGSGDFANRANFDFEEIILKSVTEIDNSDHTEQELKNYCASLQRQLYNRPMEKIVKLD